MGSAAHNREPCFFAEDDYSSYLHWLAEALGETECELHAYVLMTNQVHLLVTPKRAEVVPKLIISLGRRYVQYINRSYHRTAIDDIRLAPLTQSQPLGNQRFYAKIEQMTGIRREAKPRRRPRVDTGAKCALIIRS